MTKIRNKTLLITGAAMGLGKLMVDRAIKKGARKIILWDINQVALKKVVKQYSGISKSKIYPFIVDLSDGLAIEKTVKETKEQCGQVDILFNNAGIVVGKSFATHTIKDIDKTIDINLRAVMHVALAFIKEMIANKSGHIINISSASALIANPNMSVYASSKWAVLGWSESVRLEMQREKTGVQITTICPSYIDTGMFDGVKAPLFTKTLKPEDIVDKIFDAVEANEAVLLEPKLVKIVPFMKGILPPKVMDIAGRMMGIHGSMDSFKGRKK